MKLSVSLSAQDVAALDRYVEQARLGSRSAALQQAIRRLPDPELETAYASAWQEWADAGEEDVWATVVADGITDVAR